MIQYGLKELKGSQMPKIKKKLGKLDPIYKKGALHFGNYVKGSLPTPPRKSIWSAAVKGDWGMLGNDEAGDCTIVGRLHQIKCWLANNGIVYNPTTELALKIYSAITGYNPNDPSTDQGANEINVLDYFKTNIIDGHKILGYVSIELGNLNEVLHAMSVFGGLYTGAALPETAETQFDNGQGWTLVSKRGPGKPGSLGGHAMYYPDYDMDNPFMFGGVTWNKLQPITLGFFHYYIDELYAVVSEDWINSQTKLCPVNLDLDGLIKDLQSLPTAS